MLGGVSPLLFTSEFIPTILDDRKYNLTSISLCLSPHFSLSLKMTYSLFFSCANNLNVLERDASVLETGADESLVSYLLVWRDTVGSEVLAATWCQCAFYENRVILICNCIAKYASLCAEC